MLFIDWRVIIITSVDYCILFNDPEFHGILSNIPHLHILRITIIPSACEVGSGASWAITTCTCTWSKDHNEALSLTLLNDHACKWCDCNCRTGVVASVLLRIEKIIVHHLIELTNFLDVLKMEQFIFSLQVFNNLTDFKYCFSFLSSLNFFFSHFYQRRAWALNIKNSAISRKAVSISEMQHILLYFVSFKIFLLLVKAVWNPLICQTSADLQDWNSGEVGWRR